MTERKFTGFIRLAEEETEFLRGYEVFHRVRANLGSINLLASPFPNYSHPVYSLSRSQFQILEPRLKEAEVFYEVVEMPKYFSYLPRKKK